MALLFTRCRIAPLVSLFVFLGLARSPLYAQSSCASATFVYVNNNVDGANSVSAFCVGSGGTVTAVMGSPFPTTGSGSGTAYYGSNSITATVVGNFLYASDYSSNDIAAFSVNTSTGVLTPIGTFAYGTAEVEPNTGGISLAVTPNGQFLYAANTVSGDIWGFSINQSTGELTSLATVPGTLIGAPLYTFPSEVYPDGINVTRDGNYLAVALRASLEVAMFSIQSNGALTPVTGSPFSTPGTEGVAIGTAYVETNCAANQLFASFYSPGAADIGVETITGGALNPITPTDFTFPSATSTGYDSNVGVLSPNDDLLFVSNQLSNTIMSLNVASGGALTAATNSPYCNASSPENCEPDVDYPEGVLPTMVPTLMGTNQAGTLLFVANANYTDSTEETSLDNTVTVFTIASGGVLALVSGSGVVGSTFDTGEPGVPSLTVFPPKVCGLSVGKTFATSTNTPTVTYPSPIGFTVTVSNGISASSTATGVSVNDPLPGGAGANWAITSSTGAGSSCTITGPGGSQILSCSLGDLTAGTSASVSVMSGANSTPAPAAQLYVNTAEVTSSSGSPIYSSATVTVNPGDATEQLSENFSGTGSGYIAYFENDCIDNAGTASLEGCSESIALGALVTLTAYADEGSTFGGWGGACASAGTNPTCNVIMTGNLSVTATFNPVVYYTLTVAPQGLGAGTVQDATGQIFNCVFAYPTTSGTCSQSYPSGTLVTLTLTATPTSPSTTFGGWGYPSPCVVNPETPTVCSLSFTITSSQVITASFPLPSTETTLQFTPGSNEMLMIPYCPNNNCEDPNASAFTVFIASVSSAFSLTVVATELDPNGLCPASQVSLGGQSSDLACRFVSFFDYGTDPAGDVIVPLCYPYLNGDCVHYYLYSGTPGTPPPPGSYSGYLFLKIGWNNVFTPGPGYWAGSTPEVYDDPGSNEFPPLPYGDLCTSPMQVGTPPTQYSPTIYCQFDENITTFFTPGPGLDPIGGKIPQTNDVVVAFPPTTTGTSPVAKLPTSTAPTITVSCIAGCVTSSSSITFNQGTPGTLQVSTTGYPAPSLTETGTLPTGLTFNPTTGTLSGTPAAGTAGTYPISFTAANGVSPNATSNFTLTVSSLQLSPALLNFGTLYWGQIAVGAITLTNTGSTPMTLSKATVTTPGNALNDYISIDLCPPLISALPGILPAGKSCEIFVGVLVSAKIFSPIASTGTLDITVGNVTESVPLTLQAIYPVASLSSVVLSFGTQTTGTTSAAKEVTLTNSGSSPLQLTGLTISGNFAFAAGTNECTSASKLSPGAACAIYVTFTPTSKGLKTGIVTITDKTLIGTQLILLSGTGD